MIDQEFKHSHTTAPLPPQFLQPELISAEAEPTAIKDAPAATRDDAQPEQKDRLCNETLETSTSVCTVFELAGWTSPDASQARAPRWLRFVLWTDESTNTDGDAFGVVAVRWMRRHGVFKAPAAATENTMALPSG